MEKQIKGQPCCFSTHGDDKSKVLMIELTNSCNLSCPYCHSIPNHGGENILSDERLQQLLEEAKEQGVSTIIVSGGEPLISKRIWKFSELIKKMGFLSDLCTNGVAVTEKIAKRISEYYSSVTVTLDTINPEVYSLMKNTTSFVHQKVINGIKYLIENNVKVGITIVLTKYNFEHLDETLEYLQKLGVYKVSVLRLFHTEKSDDYEFSYSKENQKKILECIEKFPNMKIKLKGLAFDTKKFPVCTAGLFSFAVDHEGYLLPCILMRSHCREISLLNKSLNEVINGEYFKTIRTDIRNMKCQDCKFDNECRKGCPATLFGINGKVIPDVRCDKKEGC